MSLDESGQEDEYERYKSVLLAILPKIPAFTSMICSSALIAKIYLGPGNIKKIQDRIMIGLSITDVFVSTTYFLGTWLVPRATVGGFGPVFGASGNDGTCNLSGFFNQFAVASPIYNATLACYYLLRIYRNMQDHELRKIEKYFHIIPIFFALSTALVALCFNMYGNVDWVCWINPDPKETAAQKAYKVFQWTFLFTPIWICIIFQSVVMYLLFSKMRGFEREMNQYSFTTQRNFFYESMKMTKKEGLVSTNLSSSESVDRNLPSFVEKKDVSQEVSKLSMSGPISEIQKSEDYHRNDEDLEKKEELEFGDNVDSEEDGESMVRINNIGNSISSVSTLENKVSTTVENNDNDADSTGILSAVKEDENEEYNNGESASLNYENISNEMSNDSDSDDVQSERDFTLEEEKTEVRAYSRPRRSVTFGGKEDGNSKSLMTEYHQDSFLPHLKDDNEDDDHDAEKGKRGSNVLRMSTAFGSMMAKMSGKNRDSISSSMSSREQKRNLYNTNRKSRTIAIQGMLYVCAFFITWLFPTIMRFCQMAGVSPYPIQIMDSTFVPLQGFFNFFIYIRPQFVRYRETHSEVGFWKSLKEVILSH